MLGQPTFVLIQVLNSISLGMNLFIIAAGLTLIFGVLRVINFAHGAFYMIGAYACYAALAATGSFWAGVLGAALALGALAFLVERFLLRHLYGREHLMQLLFTFALVLILGDAAKLVWGTGQYSVPYPAGLDGAAELGPAHFPQYLLFLCFLGPLVAASMWLVLEKTRWGRLVRAATQDREMLAALGVNVPLVYTCVFVAGSVLAGVGGALAAPRTALTPGMDATIIVECFIVVIIGGLGSLWGSFLGALTLGFVTVFGAVLAPEVEIVLPYLLMLALLLWRPRGLLGRTAAEERGR